MPRGKVVVDSRSAPREPHDQREQNVRESADADLRRDVDPPAGRPMGDPEPELRRETSAPIPRPFPVDQQRVGAEPLDRCPGRQDGSRATAGLDEPAHQILRSTAPVALLRGAGRRAHVPRSTVQVSESGPAKPRDGRPAPFDGHHPRALSTTTMRRAHSWGSFRVELSCVLEALPSGLSAAGVGARGLMRRQRADYQSVSQRVAFVHLRPPRRVDASGTVDSSRAPQLVVADVGIISPPPANNPRRGAPAGTATTTKPAAAAGRAGTPADGPDDAR